MGVSLQFLCHTGIYKLVAHWSMVFGTVSGHGRARLSDPGSRRLSNAVVVAARGARNAQAPALLMAYSYRSANGSHWANLPPSTQARAAAMSGAK
jgi:hypothetical protein